LGTGPTAPLLQGSDGNSLTALMLAARGGLSSVVRLLLDAGAKVDATAAVAVGISGVNDGLTALMEAAASGDAATVQLRFEHHGQRRDTACA
jgi:ankyrin repeat protein